MCLTICPFPYRFTTLIGRYLGQFRFAQSYYDATVQAAAEAAVNLAESVQVLYFPRQRSSL
jgi:hypothetical protein